MPLLRVVGLDPSMRNWGIAAGEYDTERKLLSIAKLHVVQPTPPSGKQVRQSSKDLVVAEQLINEVIPFLKEAQMIFVEVPSGTQSAAGMKAYGICIGLLAAMRELGYPFMEMTPMEIKLAATGNKVASKIEMIEWGLSTFPKAPWPTQTLRGEARVIAGKAEHMADATAAIVAGVQTANFKQLVSLIT